MHLGFSDNLQWSLTRIPSYWSILWPQLSRNYPIRLQQISRVVPCWSYSVQRRIYCHLVNRLIRYVWKKISPVHFLDAFYILNYFFPSNFFLFFRMWRNYPCWYRHHQISQLSSEFPSQYWMFLDHHRPWWKPSRDGLCQWLPDPRLKWTVSKQLHQGKQMTS